jgi:hypothetical protein
MRRRGSLHPRRGHVFDQTSLAIDRMELYCTTHPRSPAALCRPRLLLRGQLWIALLGPSIEGGIVGIGPSVESALRAFDSQYVSAIRARSERGKLHRDFADSRAVR